MTDLKNLMEELVLIERRDRFYWQTQNPQRYEKLEHFLRQDRRRVLMGEILELMQGTENLHCIAGMPNKTN